MNEPFTSEDGISALALLYTTVSLNLCTAANAIATRPNAMRVRTGSANVKEEDPYATDMKSQNDRWILGREKKA